MQTIIVSVSVSVCLPQKTGKTDKMAVVDTNTNTNTNRNCIAIDVVGKDVATVLGYSNTRDALYRHVEEEDKTTVVIPDAGTNYKSKTTIISELGLYALRAPIETSQGSRVDDEDKM